MNTGSIKEVGVGKNRAAVREVHPDCGEDEFVLAVGAEFLGICTRHHAFDYRWRRPCLDIGKAILGEIGVAVRICGDIGLLRALLGRKRGVEKRVYALLAVRAADRRIVRLAAATVEVLAAAVVEPLFLAIVVAAALLLRLGLLGFRRGALGDGARKHIEFF